MNASGVETSKQVDVPSVWDVSFIHIAQSVGTWSGAALTMKGPSQGEESLCIPFVFCYWRSTKSLTTKNRSLTLRL